MKISVGSPFWIKSKYTIQLHNQVKEYLQQVIAGVKSPVIEFNGDHQYNLDFVRAVKIYAEFPEWL